ncbi:MAG TPA: UDP-N-acetylmuramate dehydrogenase [Acidobacteriota bacterium]|nr:UDP-N-acetylmuramate dehydrogenase [Acidobacteriota bacterium]
MKTKTNQKLKDYTTIGIGGTVPIVYLPETEAELADLLRTLNSEKRSFRIIGNGSNILADDTGFGDAVIVMKHMERIFEVDGERVTVDAGYPMAQLAYQTASKSLSGLEFAVGIPGSIGGVVRMNAGAHGQTISEVVHSVAMLLREGHLVVANNSELQFAYRHSAIPRDAIITRVILQLRKGDSREIHKRIRENNDWRTSTQPIREKSAGCIFRNPEGTSAGKLIEESGLKGFSIGDAMVSDVHANFIINKGHATFADATKLIEHIKNVVREKKGISLKEEVIVWRHN